MITDGIVWLVVSALQMYFILKGRALAREDDRQALEEVLAAFERDVSRTGRGDATDWSRYAEEGDRLVDNRSDQLRTFATAALSTGIGGTMLALSLNLVLSRVSSGSAPPVLEELMASVRVALVASLLGVVNHLYILLVLTRRLDIRSADALRVFRRRLWAISEANPSGASLGDKVRSELTASLKAAVSEIPAVFERLDARVESLGAIITDQSKTLLTAVAGLKESAGLLIRVRDGIGPAAEQLVEATTQLTAMPAHLSTVLEQTREAWAARIREDQEQFLSRIDGVLTGYQRVLLDTKQAFESWEASRQAAAIEQERSTQESIRLVQTSSSEIVSAVSRLPGLFSDHVGSVGDTLGDQFGLQARNLIADLVTKIDEDSRALRAHIGAENRNLQNIFLTSSSDVVAETLRKVYDEVSGTLLAPLADVGRRLSEATTDLPASAQGFAQTLARADERLLAALDHLAGATAHLQQIGQMARKSEEEFLVAVRNAVIQQTRTLEPLQQNMTEFITSVKAAHDDLNRIVQSQVDFMTDVLAHLTTSEDILTGEERTA